MNPYFLAAVALTVIVAASAAIGVLVYLDLKDTE